MQGFLLQLDYWHWLILGVVLMILEALLPGTYFLWMGVAAFFVGVILLLLPALSWEVQFILFAVVAVSSILVWRIWQRKHPTQTDRPVLNRRAEQYLDRSFTLVEAIENGVGIIVIDDTRWQVRGPDLAKGRKVKVVRVQDAELIVIAAD